MPPNMSTIRQKPLVSVIIPCYNQAQYLQDSVGSLIAQSYSNWECIIVNDGSRDNTADVAECLAQGDHRVRLINQINRGLSNARNSGMASAEGKFFQFLDADDMLESDKFTVQVAKFLADSSVDVVFGDARYFTTDDFSLRDVGPYARDGITPWIPELWYRSGPLLDKALRKNLFPVNCPLVRNTVFRKVGVWNESLAAHEDWEFWIRCVLANIKFQFTDEPNTLALIRMQPTSMTHDSARMRSSIFKMRISIGSLSFDPVDRMTNFTQGLAALDVLSPANLFSHLAKLVLANRSPSVFLIAFLYYIIRFPILRNLPVIYKNYMPWPIQRFIALKLHLRRG